MDSIQGKRDEDVTVASNLGRVVRDDRRVTARSNAANLVGNPTVTRQPLETALKGVYTSVPRADGEITFNGLAHRPMREERPVSRIRPTQSYLSAWLENTACD